MFQLEKTHLESRYLRGTMVFTNFFQLKSWIFLKFRVSTNLQENNLNKSVIFTSKFPEGGIEPQSC